MFKIVSGWMKVKNTASCCRTYNQDGVLIDTDIIRHTGNISYTDEILAFAAWKMQQQLRVIALN